MTEVKMATTTPQQSSNMGDLDHGQTLKAVKSYGIEIDASKIDEVSYENRPENLRELGVNVFDQDVFEEGVLRQVDDAISQLQGAYERQELEKELQKIEKELGHIAYKLKARYIPEKKLENLISENEKLVKKKENILKKLNIETGDVFDDDTECDDVKDNKSSTSEDSLAERLLSFGGHKETDSERCIRLGEMTPFGSVVEETASPKESRVTAQDQSFTQSELNDMDATVIESDDDYIPNDDDLKLSWQDDDISDDNNDYLEGEQQELSLTEIKNLYRKEKKKVVRKNNQDIDDGNDKIYQTRIRRVKLKKSLKEEGIEYEEQSDEEGNISDEEHVDEVFGNGLKIPGKVWSKLFRYQKTGVKWLWELHCQQAGGIVGDEMGLGKTIQIIAFLAGLKYSNLTQRASRQSGLGPVLVICPATVMYQWVREFHKWWPEFRVAVLHDTGSHQGSKSKLVDKIRATPGILITTYSGVRLNQEYLLPAKWDYVILDEGHIIRNPDAEITLVCKQFRTCHRIILSGSPMQNNLRELWSLFDFVFPGKLGTLPVFMQEFSVPITMGGYANASTVQVQTAYKCACVLRDTINPYLLRRMKKDVKMKLNLPNKNEQVLFCRLTQEQIEVYKEYLASRDVSSILSGNMKVFPGLIMLRKICNHPDLTTEAGSLWKLKKDRESDCQQADEYGHWQRSGKLIVVQSLLKLWKKQKHKVLLFSQTKQMLEILEIFVKSQGYKYFRMDGSTNIGSRQTLVQNFNKDKTVFVFLLTTRVGGLGLNLVGANRVIIFDPDWNPGTDMQAKERAWRVGQKRDVTIYRLLTTGTIEEKIYHRQIFKQFLTNRVLKDPKQRRFFKSNDLFELFTLDTRDDKTSGTETGAIFAGIGCEVEMPGKIATKRNLEIQKHTDLMVKKKKVVSKMKEKTMEILRSQFSSNSTSSKTTVNTPSAGNSIGNDRDNPEEDRNVPENNREDLGSSSSENKPEIPECNRTIPDNIRSTSNGHTNSTLNDMRTSSDGTRSLPRNHRTETENTRTTPDPLRTSSVGHRDQAEKGESSLTAPEAPSSVQNRRVPDKMTSSNPDDVTAGGKVASVTSSSEHKRKSKKTKKAKKNKRSKIEGIHIGHLSHSEEYVPKNEEEETNDHDEQYILRKLFKKSGVHSALQHDTIVESGNADILLVENEAKRVARQAAEALRRSREQCMLQQSRSGLPTWTGQSGYVGSPHVMRKPLFGSASTTKPPSTNQDTNAPHFSGESLTRNAGDTETNDEAMSSSILLARMRARNTIGGNQTGSAILTNESNYNQIMAELRQFIASGCSLPGHATTQEILDKFGGRLPINDNAIFRAMLKTICNFDRSDSGQGYWVLKTEY